MKSYYIDKIKELTEELKVIQNQFDNTSSIGTDNKFIDSLIYRMMAIESDINYIYTLAKTNRNMLYQ